MKTCVEKKLFGEVNGTEVYAVSIRSSEVELVVLSYGCIIQSLRTKDQDGVFDDIVTGWDDLDGTVKNIRFTGRAIGRYANRIHNGQFELDGKVRSFEIYDMKYRAQARRKPSYLIGLLVEVCQNQIKKSISNLMKIVEPCSSSSQPGDLHQTENFNTQTV